MVSADATSADQRRGFPVGLILFLTFLHIVNQIDRQLVAAFAAEIMRDLELNRCQFALIAGLAFSGVYAFAALFAGVLADRLGRVKVLSGGLGIWSLFTALAGLAQGFWTLLAIGFASDRLAAAGSAQSWTWPLMGADALALLAIPCAWLAMRSPRVPDAE